MWVPFIFNCNWLIQNPKEPKTDHNLILTSHPRHVKCLKLHIIISQFILGFLRITMISREIIKWLSYYINDYVCQSGKTKFNGFGVGEVFIPTWIFQQTRDYLISSNSLKLFYKFLKLQCMFCCLIWTP